jgi:hypothetical protein
MAACGQFMDSDSTFTIRQRGLHGTAAAISVVARAEIVKDGALLATASDVVERLVRYAEQRSSIESNTANEAPKAGIETDERNVIKCAELLYSLSGVSSTVPNVQALKAKLIKALTEGMVRSSEDSAPRGWDYFTDERDNKPQMLPTAHAVLALASVGVKVSQPLAYLRAALEDNSHSENADISIRIFALYVLTFYKESEIRRDESDEKISRIFDTLWGHTYRLLEFGDLEQNIEYWRGNETLYVRVPWQLFLLALAARLRFKRFATVVAQQRLSDIVTALKENRFRYAHSGRMISTRTTAIAFEVVGQIIGEMRRREIWAAFLIAVDNLRTSFIPRMIAGVIAFVVMGAAIWTWLFSPSFSVADVAPDFVCSLLIWLVLWSKGESR